MGRELKRVPMDFDWPIGKVWHGYLNPHYRKCPRCERGLTSAREYLEAVVRLLAIGGSSTLRKERHPWMDGFPFSPSGVLSQDIVDLTTGLCGRSPSCPFGHDSLDVWRATKAIIGAAGLDSETWGICQHCGGDAVDPETKSDYEAWKSFDPPSGDGFQLWETTSEGSPRSPVFATLDELCRWCEENATTFGSSRASAGDWRQMLDQNFVHHTEGNVTFM